MFFNFPAMALVVLGGLAAAAQAPVNAALARSLGSPVAAAAVSFAVGLVLLLGLTVLWAGPAVVLRLPGVPLWQLAGGILGALYVFSMVMGVPRLGVVSALAALIVGQMLGAMVLDSSGAFGLAVQAITPSRVLAVAMVIGGLVLSRL